MSLEFVDTLPPANIGARGRRLVMTEEVCAQLQARPGQWAKLKTCIQTGRSPATALAQAQAVHYRKWWKQDGYEFAAREGSIYVRYSPPAVAPSPGSAP